MDLRQREQIDRWRREIGGHPAGVRVLERPGSDRRRPIARSGVLVVASGCLAAWMTLLAWSGSASSDPSRADCSAHASAYKACSNASGMGTRS